MNCLNAQYADPDLDSLAETLIFNPNGGAVVFWGSTSFTPPSIQKIYQEAFYENMSRGQFRDLGDLVLMSKVQAGLSSPFEEILYSWSIIGDPMVRPAITHQKDVTPESNTQPDPTPRVSASTGGSGCAAIASDRLEHPDARWSLFLSFLLEVAIVLSFMRMIKMLIPTGVNCK